MNLNVVAIGRRIFSLPSPHFLITDSPSDENISIILNGIESELKFITDSKGDKVRQQVEAERREIMKWLSGRIKSTVVMRF